MLTLTLVVSGWPAALRDGMGIVAAHFYDFLTRIYPTFGGASRGAKLAPLGPPTVRRTKPRVLREAGLRPFRALGAEEGQEEDLVVTE
ncbi:centromere/microtubule-binding protein Cbf5 [Aspergillus luchuensis]|uniref:Centromere/microtubule-binding protein Cbf5 n=1 Tax=Aspergillus kawachii TaxID=1069201 RepID=A0A146FZF0_ASPKA|nr:centromere/microtubule-binding protein Cbf5 [Aspergillus luchuensis]